MTRENNKTNSTTTLWTYDELGNISAKTEYAYTTGTPSTATKTVTYGYGKDSKSSWNNLLVSVDKNGNETTDANETITYDAIGNPLTYLGATLTWDGRQLTTYAKDNTVIEYTYDANGLRASKTVSKIGKTTISGIEIPYVTEQTETKYYYVNGQLHYQHSVTTDTNGNQLSETKLHFYYDSYGYLTGIKYNGTNYYVATNKRGDVVALYYYDGRIMGRYEYDAWGNVIKIEDIYYDTDGNQVTADLTNNATSRDLLIVNPIRYRSYYYDLETDLYYLQSRYYNAQVGRFLNSDSISDSGAGVLGFNTFIYCANNPVNASDPSGHWIIKNAIKWIATKIKSAATSVERSLSKIDLTYSKGISVDASPGIWNFNVQAGFSIDTEGNVGLQCTVAGGVTASDSPSGSAGKYEMITNAPNINKLEGTGYQFGGSFNAPLPAPISISGGREFNIIPDDKLNKHYYGVTRFMGIAPPKASAEGHVEWGETFPISTTTNVFDTIDSVCVKIMEW